MIRVAGTRVTLDAVVAAFDAGATPEEIVQKFPTIELSEVYAVCAHLLAHRTDVDSYLTEQAEAAAEIRTEMEARFPSTGIRERLLARRRIPA